MSNDCNCNVHIGFGSSNCNKTFCVQKENAPSLFSRMLVSVTSEVAWIEIHVARIKGHKIRHEKEYKLNLTLPFKPYPVPPIPHPRNSHGAIFDRECERRLLVRVMGRRFTAVFRLPHILQK